MNMKNYGQLTGQEYNRFSKCHPRLKQGESFVKASDENSFMLGYIIRNRKYFTLISYLMAKTCWTKAGWGFYHDLCSPDTKRLVAYKHIKK